MATRVLEPELMDAPDLERARHLRALDALARVNRVSLTAPRIWREIRRLERRGLAPVRVLDVACGGGDVVHALARRAAGCGIEVELHGCDVSPVALARARALAPSGSSTSFFELDVLREPLPAGYDLIVSSLFLHHLTSEGAVALLSSAAQAVGRVLLIQDLRRTRLGYALAWLGLHTLTRSDVARSDGLASVRAAFTLEEVREMCREAGLGNATVRTCWPQRVALRWERA